METSKKCCICGGTFHSSFEGKDYCSKHYSQMKRNGHILERTIYDSNSFNIKDNVVLIQCYNKQGIQTGEFIIDLLDFKEVSKHKWYIRVHKSKLYVCTSIKGNKILLHKFLINTDQIIDHINGNSLDNRRSNLREVSIHLNNLNKKSNKFAGIIKTEYMKEKPYMCFITYDKKEQYLGSFKTYEEAVFCRLSKEKELFKEFGSHAHLYYILNHPSPITELKKVLIEGA